MKNTSKDSTPFNVNPTVGYESLEGQPPGGSLEHPAESEKSPGITDPFETWSGSSTSFNQAGFHAVCYLTIGIVAYSFVLNTQWSLIDSAYFSVVIFTTVGYGDLSPDTSTAGMIFTIFFALYGITVLGIFLGILGDLAVERHQVLLDAALKRTRTSYLMKILEDFEQSGSPPWEESEESPDSNQSVALSLHILNFVKGQLGNIVVLMIIALPIILMEGWSPVKGIYWMAVTGTTVGLGDEYPGSAWSKIICIFYIPLLVAFAGNFLGSVASFYVEKRNDAVESMFLNRAMRESDLDRMDTNHDHKVSRVEFLVYMLTTMQKVDKSDIEEIFDVFEKLDKDKSGILSTNDLSFISEKTTMYQQRSVRLRKGILSAKPQSSPIV
mmetsp:Transcript_18829/g.52614  ORF Transcript_18829/g.52614 Transcript_18829/m.52614 type:complete len:383 (-) Transcript_18829:303-1451(-)|eukprot:CAMPEP_0172367942 /NCGR_PEP_ID=MMETSP1060-20121228/24726_1 /TAXON_ID=37318 /ORGANISM="Pseudo-nitzschia pungens, Strain cf. cingulata" /LENGTH=382 /DNA_ID=CAMNT_0013092381 /DNA_START=84 /DNA_END=1232 /DNA_ORIENTATION=-